MEQLKQLRERTGAGISDCKKALDEASGDMEKAIEILRKKGIAKAAKRGEREAAEGIILVDTDADAKEGYIVEINIETDFAGKSERFLSFANEVMAAMKSAKPETAEALLALPLAQGTVKETMDTLSGVIGEKIEIKRAAIVKSQGTVAAYSHLAGRIGVLVALDVADKQELARDIAMQIAAANPQYVRPEDVPAEAIDKEKEIFMEQLKKEGKPEAIAEKIMTGKIGKFFEEICLIKQEFIKDDKKKVEAVLGEAKVEMFLRYGL